MTQPAAPGTPAVISSRRLAALGSAALLLACALAAYGIVRRRAHEATLARETDASAIPIVSVVAPHLEAAASELSLPGEVRAYYAAPIHAQVSGIVKSWRFDIGAAVHRGDVLATIETPALDEQAMEARAQLALARANLQLARSTAARWNALLASNSVSRQSAEEKSGDAEAKAAEVAVQEAHLRGLEAMQGFKTLRAPFDGTVTARNVDIGALVEANAPGARPLFEVSDLHAMRVYVDAPQAQAARLRPGLAATLTQPQYPDARFPAKVETTSGAVAARSRTLLVELLAPNPDGRLLPGSYARVTVALPAGDAVPRIPTGAVIFREHGPQVAVLDAHDRVSLRPVKLGRDFGTEVAVRDGLSATDRVVNAPPDTLQDGETVQVAAP